MEFFFTKYGLKPISEICRPSSLFIYNLYWSLHGRAKTITQPIYENENISFWSSQWKKDLLVAFCREIKNFFLFLPYMFFFFFYIWVLIVFLNNNSLYCNFGFVCSHLFVYLQAFVGPCLDGSEPGTPLKYTRTDSQPVPLVYIWRETMIINLVWYFNWLLSTLTGEQREKSRQAYPTDL